MPPSTRISAPVVKLDAFHSVALLAQLRTDDAGAGRGDFQNDFVGLDFRQGLVGLDLVARLLVPYHERAVLDGFGQLIHSDLDDHRSRPPAR